MVNISRHYKNSHIKCDSFDTHLAIYEDQIRGWFFDQARELDKSSYHAGFITLLVVLSYIEGHSIFYKGKDSKNNSREFFNDAFKKIIPLTGESPEIINRAIDELYDQMRNGLFHTGMTRGKVLLIGNIQIPIQIIIDKLTNEVVRIEVNPVKMLDVVEDHLSHYVMRLRNVDEKELRDNFSKAWSLRMP